MFLVTLALSLSLLAWVHTAHILDIWSSSNSSTTPNSLYFLKTENTSLLKPSLECNCPPSQECPVKFKLNEDMIEFLKMQGLETDDLNNIETKIRRRMEPYNKDNHIEFIDDKTRAEVIRSRRLATTDQSECCCPPRGMLMPTYITNHKFKQIIRNMKKSRKN